MKNAVIARPCSMNSVLAAAEGALQLAEVVESALVTPKLMDADILILTLTMIVTILMLKIMLDSGIMKLMEELLMLNVSLVISTSKKQAAAKLLFVSSIIVLAQEKRLNSKFNLVIRRLFVQKRGKCQ